MSTQYPNELTLGLELIGGINQKEPVPEMLGTMAYGQVYQKGNPQIYGDPKWEQIKFLVYIFDGFKNYKAWFDACHWTAFEVGDEIGYESKLQNGRYLIYKKHKIHNKTIAEQAERIWVMRPKEEVEYLSRKAEKRYDEIKSSLTLHPPQQAALSLRQEQKDVVRLIGLLKFALTGELHPHPDVNPQKAFSSCHVVTRYIGEAGETLESVLERAERRMESVSQTVQNVKDSEEFVNLTKLITAIKWCLDQDTYHTDLGIHFGWGIFGRKLKDDYTIHGNKRDEYLIPERRKQDRAFLLEDTANALTKLNEQKQEKRLVESFPFLKKKGGIPQPKKGGRR